MRCAQDRRRLLDLGMAAVVLLGRVLVLATMKPVRVEMTPSGWRSSCCMIQAQPPARTAVSVLAPIVITVHRGNHMTLLLDALAHPW